MRGKGEVHRGREAEFISEVGQTGRAGGDQAHRNQLLRLRVGQRANQHAVEHTKHGCIRSDADGQCEHHGDREPRRPPQPTAYMLQIHQQRFESWPLPHFTAPLTDKCHIAEIATRSSFGLIARHALFHQFIHSLFDMFLNGDRDVVIPAISEEEAAEP